MSALLDHELAIGHVELTSMMERRYVVRLPSGHSENLSFHQLAEFVASVKALVADDHKGTTDMPTAICLQCSLSLGVKFADLMSSRRFEVHSHARQLAMYLIREMTNLSYPAIGDYFRRDHGTVMHACKAVANRMDVDPAFRAKVAAIETALKGEL